jgi:L-ascorbate metabolism protein UlaG (beta-lactamase superfamily)
MRTYEWKIQVFRICKISKKITYLIAQFTIQFSRYSGGEIVTFPPTMRPKNKRQRSVLAMVLYILLGILLLLVIGFFVYLQLPVIGGQAKGERLTRMQSSPHYREGQFHNIQPTPNLTEGYSMPKVFFDFLTKTVPNQRPARPIPTVHSDIHSLQPDQEVVIWFGHSSYFLQLNGVKMLVDPVFSGNASPLPGTAKAFQGADAYGPDDFPALDWLLITHDHYDHLDYVTIRALKDKVKKVVCGLGVGAHLERWGYLPEQILELDWYESTHLDPSIELTAWPSRHFSGRTFKRNSTLWCSFLLRTADQSIYIGGDSGYGVHFATLKEKYGPVDVAILDNGQYNDAWKAIHMLPEDVLQAGLDLETKVILPVHNSKFSLAPHAWDAPMTSLHALRQPQHPEIWSPQIGQIILLRDSLQSFERWWENN